MLSSSLGPFAPAMLLAEEWLMCPPTPAIAELRMTLCPRQTLNVYKPSILLNLTPSLPLP